MTSPRNARDPAAVHSDLNRTAWNDALAAVASGFAHDANNCLTGIFSMSDLCLAQVDAQNPLQESLLLIRESAHQASQILQRLTRMVYDTPGTRTYHNLNEITSDVTDVLRRILPRNLQLVVEVHPKPLAVHADAVQLRQTLIFLALNAAEAIGGAGKVGISTRICKQLPNAAWWGARPATPCVGVAVSDTGPARTDLAQIHSTLKNPAPDLGTAPRWLQRLYLAKLCAESHGGCLAIEPAKVSGTTAQIYLPQADLGSS